MNQHLQTILDFIKQADHLSVEEKATLTKAAKEADSALTISEFKLERTEKVKRTTAILLEETIEELEQKRKAIEIQNRDLEVEAALERVRTVTMGMRKRDDMLDICRIITEQLELLKVKDIRNVQTAIFYESKGIYINYEFYARHDKTLITEVDYRDHEVHTSFAENMLKGAGEMYTRGFTGKEVLDWYEHQKTTNVYIDTYLEKAGSLNYYWHSLGPVALGISTYSPLDEQGSDLFRRFMKVFELSYRRYLDIEKAEMQAYEAKVEASLEKVRAVAMGMNKPDDLLHICETLFKEFNAFGFIDLRNAMINIHNDEEKTFVNYDYSDIIGQSTNHLSYNIHPVIEKQVAKMRSANDAFSETVFAGEDLEEWKKFRKKIGEKDDPRINKAGALYYYFYSIGTGSIGISTFSPVNEENLALLKRFRNVFNLSYQRYIDLALAEVQAKEAKIEASLERIRTKAMGMRKSEEVVTICEAMYKELALLGFTNIRNAQIAIKNDAKQSYQISVYSPNEVIVMRDTSYRSSPIVEELYHELEKSRDAFFQKEFSGKKFSDWRKWREGLSALADPREKAADSMCFYLYAIGSGHLGISTFNAITGEQVEIVKRFKNVFELSYQRYTDVAKAEAQAREAQVELALERVRARTMAMQKSAELSETAYILYQQFKELGQDPEQLSIGIINEPENVVELWLTRHGNEMKHMIPVSLDEPFVMSKMYAAWKQQKKSLIIDLSGQDLKDYNNYRNSLRSDIKMTTDRPDERRVINIAFFSKGQLALAAPAPISAEGLQLLERFAGVFDLTYTRFLDLQKAEARAREAQIETALERVRSRTMAMRRSDELLDTSQLFFQQIRELGETVIQASIAIVNEEAGFVELSSSIHGSHLPHTLNVPIDDPFVMAKGVAAWKAKQKSLTLEFKGQELKDYNERRNSFLQTKVNFPEDQWIVNLSFFSKGWFSFSSNKHESGEIIAVLKRFAAVFEQTYTRFLDLKKAEAQARESEIELALERVRARTMAMQKSEELKNAAALLFQQVKTLGAPAYSCGYNIWGENEKVFTSWMSIQDGSDMNAVYNIPLTEDANFIRYVTSKQKAEPFFVLEMRGERMQEHYRYLKTIPAFKAGFEYAVKAGFPIPETQIHYVVNFSQGNLLFITLEPCPEFHDVFKRFAAVFDQTYTRFLDLQKAETQAKEAKIEAALEKIRSRTMAMQRSDELSETAAVLFQEFKKLGEDDLLQLTIGINKEEERLIEFRVTNWAGGGAQVNRPFNLSIEEPTLLKPVFTAWKEQKKSVVVDLTGKKLEGWLNYRNAHTGITVRSEDTSGRRVISVAFFSKGHISISSPEPRPPETIELLERFAGVFDLTYTRFNDLKLAEAQAREAKIETALERVRSRTMAMHKSNDLMEVISVLSEQFRELGFKIDSSNFNTSYREKQWDLWLYNPGAPIYPEQVHLPYFDHPLFNYTEESLSKGNDFFSLVLNKKEKDIFLDHLYAHANTDIPKERKDYTYNKPGFAFSSVCLKNTAVTIANFDAEPYTEDQNSILRRFGTVFEQSYTRFLDLQKAEAQAREARVEVSLERIRARTMAMHGSDDVSTATGTMFTELEKLGIENIRGGIAILNDNQTMEVWSVTDIADNKTIKGVGSFDTNAHTIWKQMFKAWKMKDEYFLGYLDGKEKEDYINILNSTASYLSQPIEHLPDMNFQAYFFAEGAIWTYSLQSHSQEDRQLMKRFASVFALTFRRFLDLQKAEAQTKEAIIEAALEKVRGKAMAMHNSDDLSATASMVFTELRKLGIKPIRCGVGLLKKDSAKAQLYSATAETGGDSLALIGWVMLTGHPVLENIYESWEKNEDYFPELSGQQLKSYYELLLSGLSVTVPEWQDGQKQYGHFIPFSVGCLYAWSETAYTEAEIKILKRFASIIDLTFRRYIELQKSEANAKEAVKQAALDRVRAETASMRTTADLEKITPLIWNELTILNIPFIRCGVFIMDESQQLIHTFLSTPDGKAIAAFHLPYSTPGNIGQVLSHWQEKKNYIDNWNEQAFTEFAHSLVKQGALASPEQYLKTLPQGGFYLHFLPFLQGMLYVGNTTQLSEEEIELIQSVADAFSTAYARYEDFNKLEVAKKQVDSTLNELQATQKQLIQSEKMASLGELTAGIAHEIQNPLNFVNNFSEVNTELIDEMKAELATGNLQGATEIANDIKENEQKINHHGKRADAIVKGMLQHSRSSSGQKESTDINALADEYLRLAYHGLRAKDKSFNATMKTDFDSTIGKIQVFPQDLGRVILNLITNAFYAVSEKKKQQPNGYEPTVTVSTSRSPLRGKGVGGEVQISVRDNGNGIPQKILDKIFQPFFTTKPTGQGTGLGLSLSYDIVKAHNGELKVETREGEGTEFIIQLPVN